MPEGVVLQIGDAARIAADRIGRIRGWHVEELRDTKRALHALRTVGSRTVLIATDRESAGSDFLLDAAQVAALAAPNASVGVVYGSSADDFANASARFESRSHLGVADQQLLLARSDQRFRGARMLPFDEAADIANVRAREPAELGFIFGHGNGLDMDIGCATLCCRDEAPPVDSKELRIFPCFRGADCGRCKPGQPRLGPGAMKTRRLVMLACWGILTSEQVFDPRLSIGAGLLRNPDVEVILTTVRASVLDGMDLPHLYYLANQGLPFGVVANRANQTRIERGLEADFLCFGDPETKIARSIEPTRAVLEHDGTYLVSTDESRATVDIAIEASTWSAPGEPIVLTEGNPAVQGAYRPNKTLFLSVPPGTSQMRFRIVDRRSLVPEAGLVALATDLSFATLYAHQVAGLTGSEHAQSALRAIAQVKDRVHRICALAEVPAGTVLPAMAIGGALRNLQSAMAESAGYLAEAFADAVHALGGHHLIKTWRDSHRVASASGKGVCQYCHGSQDEIVFRPSLGGQPRTIVLCRACGPTLDGDPSLGSAMRVDARDETSLIVDLPARNPYPFDAPASGVAVLETFKTGECSRSDTARATVSANGTGKVSVEIAVPGTFVSGIHYVSGSVVVGGRMQFLKRPIHIFASPAFTRSRRTDPSELGKDDRWCLASTTPGGLRISGERNG